MKEKLKKEIPEKKEVFRVEGSERRGRGREGRQVMCYG